MTTDQANNSRMIKDQEIDELLSKLTIEELEELQIELVDEDVNLLEFVSKSYLKL